MFRFAKRGLLSAALFSLTILATGAVAAQDAVTLTVWDNFTREAEQEMIENLHAEFVAAHPGVVIVRESYETSDLTNLLPLALSESSGPDVAMINQGIANMGSLVQADLLLPLDSYAEQYGWLERYGEGLHRRNRFTEGATQFGEGDLYGMSNTAEVVGLFYHKGIFEQYGLTVPTTLAEFETLAQTLIDNGVTPIAFGSLDGWPAIHEYGAIENAYTTLEDLDSLIFRFEGGTFDNAANLQAAEKLVEWANAGYFSEGFEGMDYDNATTGAFLNQDAAMWLTGSWVAGTINDNLDPESVGFFLLPDEAGSEVPLATGGVGLGYGIRATSENADLAAEYIDLMTGPRAAELLFEQGYLPAVAVDPAVLTDGTLTSEVVAAWEAISANDRVGHYLDWTIPYDDVVASLQELLGGVISPADFVANVEAAYVDSAP
jgi:raffinose/stachyose/melibiose transport system substrate-binding protein